MTLLNLDIGTLAKVNNFYWPPQDKHCKAVVFDTTADIELAMKYVRGTECVIQAGGNCGVWPKYLADKFAAVYTFEPDPVNFLCLNLNVPQSNVYKFQAALGDINELISLEGNKDNCGAYQVSPNRRGAHIPTLRLDDFELQPDLIILDIEGYEMKALRGASYTLQSCRPVIQIEDKGLSEKYGIKKGEVITWLQELGYEVVETIHRDIILCHKSLL